MVIALVSGLVFMAAGAWLGEDLSHRDAVTEINGITEANSQLHAQNGKLEQQNGSLHSTVTMLRSEQASLDKLVRLLAATNRHIRLYFDAHGNVIGGDVVSGRGEVTDSKGRPVTASPRPH
jgi:hypothetical protein